MKKVKVSKLENLFFVKKISTLYLDCDTYDYEDLTDDNKFPRLSNVENIIISDKFKHNECIDIYETTAKNIYFENSEHKRGLNIDFEKFLKKDLMLCINNERLNMNNLEKINIFFADRNFSLNIDKTYHTIQVYKDTKKNLLIIDFESKKERFTYEVNQFGKVNVIKYNYMVDDKDIVNNCLDLRHLINYEAINVPKKYVETLIIDDECIRNIFKLRNMSYYGIITNIRFCYDKVKVIENNPMKLFPFDKTFNINKYCEFLNLDRECIYLKTEDDEIIIYIGNELKKGVTSISKKEIESYNNVEDIKFVFKEKNTLTDLESLILVKYKNGEGRVINFDKSFKISDGLIKYMKFNKFKYLKTPIMQDLIEQEDWFNLFQNKLFDNILFFNIMKDYEKFNEYLKYLTNLGLTKSAIEYLLERDFLSIRQRKIDVETLKLTQIEIDCFNIIGEEFEINKKTLKLK